MEEGVSEWGEGGSEGGDSPGCGDRRWGGCVGGGQMNDPPRLRRLGGDDE